MKRTLILLTALLLTLSVSLNSHACTTAVISGKYTEDGRPMLWKLRDTDFLRNAIKYFTDGKYSFIGLINSDDNGKQVWAGVNEEGFAIMNAASFNVNPGYTGKKIDREGLVMRQALAQCKDIKEFKRFLEKMDTPRGLATSFGVIDAQGGAAYFEVDNENVTMFDANDGRFAPHGYIIRTNYSFTGEKDKGYGYIRYQSADDLFAEADATGTLNYKTIIQNFSKSFYHSLLKTDFKKEAQNLSTEAHFLNSGDFMTRQGTSSAVVIQGIKNNESPLLTTMWSLVGFPHTTVAIPLWVTNSGALPQWVQQDSEGNAPICSKSLELKKQCYPISRSSGFKYMDIAALINKEGTGIIQQLKPLEDNIIKEAEKYLSEWRENGPTDEEVKSYYQWIDQQLNNFFK